MDPAIPSSSSTTGDTTTTTTTTNTNTTTNTKKTPRSTSNFKNNDKLSSSTTTTISVDPVGPRKKKKKDRTNMLTTTNPTNTSSSSKGNHPKKLRLHESNLSSSSQPQHHITDPSSSSNVQPLSSSSSLPDSSLPSHRHQKDTATADGHMMHEMLNTFSTNEYQRFQSYQRSSFSSSVIENYIAACIEYRYHHHHHRGPVATPRQSTIDPHHSNQNQSNIESLSSVPLAQLPTRLEDYVSTPSQASEIGMIVATAAKIYAQRLMAEAAYLQNKDRRRTPSRSPTTNTNHTSSSNSNNDNTTTMDLSSTNSNTETTMTVTAKHNQDGNKNNNNSSSSSTTGSIHNNVLLCTYVYQAVQDRQLRNVDPGFFVASPTIHNPDYNVHSTTSHLLYDQRRLATMAAVENTIHDK